MLGIRIIIGRGLKSFNLPPHVWLSMIKFQIIHVCYVIDTCMLSDTLVNCKIFLKYKKAGLRGWMSGVFDKQNNATN